MHTTFQRTVTTVSLILHLGLFNALRANEQVYQQALRSAAFVVNLEDSCSGSGVLVDRERGHVLTNDHVTGSAEEVAVFFPQFDNQRVVAERQYYAERAEQLSIAGRVVARDKSRDLALIELEHVPEGVEPIAFASGSQPGQNVHSIGNPGASDALWVYTAGQVRAVYHRQLTFDDGMVVDANVVETTSPVNPGDSGGPVLNDQGQLIALVQSTGANDLSVCVDVRELSSFLQSGSKPKSDPRVRHALDKQELKYQIDDDGDFRLVFTMEDGGEHVVYVMSQTEQLGPFEVREVWAPLAKIDDSFTRDDAIELLRVAGQYKIGCGRLVGSDDNLLAIFCARVPANLDAASLESVIRGIVETGYEISDKAGNAGDDATEEEGTPGVTIRTEPISARCRTAYLMSFPAGSEARVSVVGSGDTDLDLHVLEVVPSKGEDEMNEVVKDERDDDRCEVSWTPQPGRQYLVVLVNYGELNNLFTLRTNGVVDEVEPNLPLQK